jgi:hypothetical protein
MCDSRRGFELGIGFIDHLPFVATSNYNNLNGITHSKYHCN